MMDSLTIQLAQRGVLTLPKPLRDAYDLREGDEFTLLDFDGVFILSPRRSEVDALARKIGSAISSKEETLENMLIVLREERERYGRREGEGLTEQGERAPGHERAVRRHLVRNRRRKGDPKAR